MLLLRVTVGAFKYVHYNIISKFYWFKSSMLINFYILHIYFLMLKELFKVIDFHRLKEKMYTKLTFIMVLFLFSNSYIRIDNMNINGLKILFFALLL